MEQMIYESAIIRCESADDPAVTTGSAVEQRQRIDARKGPGWQMGLAMMWRILVDIGGDTLCTNKFVYLCTWQVL